MRRKQAPRAKHLFTDASCAQYFRGISSWSGMLIDGCSSVLRANLLGIQLKNPTLAEFMAVRRALSSFYRSGHIIDGDTILLHTDSTTVAKHTNHLDQPITVKHEALRKEIRNLRRFVDARSLIICPKWVKAHAGVNTEDWRQLINARVDREARHLTRNEVKRLREHEQKES